MALRVAATSDDRAIAIRDHIVPLVRERGAIQVQHDAVRSTELRMGIWSFLLWTPFNELGVEEAASPGYRHAIERQRSRKTLPYGLDIRHEANHVLRIMWSDDANIQVAHFARGPWEDAALLL